VGLFHGLMIYCFCEDEEAMALKIGDKVVLCGDHPWAGYRGTVVGWEVLGLNCQTMTMLKLSNGARVVAQEPDHIRLIESGVDDG